MDENQKITNHGILLSVDANYSARINHLRNSVDPDKTRGAALISVFLGNILPDSCSAEVIDCFIESFAETLERMKMKLPLKF